MTDAARRISSGALALSIAALLSGCQQRELIVPKIPGLEPYRMTIQQGNYLSQEMVAQLKLGMTREQVRFVLGTPLVQDAFHADRWDYVFYREVPGAKREQRNLSVVFEKDRLARVIGDLVPPEGAAPQPTGFVPQVKPDAPVAKPAPVAPKPAAETARPAAEPPKPVAEPSRPGFDLGRSSTEPARPAAVAEPEPPTQNWRAASDEPEKTAEPAPAGAEAPKPPAETKAEDKNAEEPKERGFFGRLLQKIGL
jgi:outer membrane protein assembly factor BamE